MVVNSQVAFLNTKVLLVDVGGTNIRTAIAKIGSDELIDARKENLECLDSFDEMLRGFLDKDLSIKHIVFSIAGPKLHHSISMTNRKFHIDEQEILNKFDIDSCHLLNDWESIGHGLSLFNAVDISFINKGDSFNSSALILGPGTGLGAAQVVQDKVVLPTEIGNSSLMIPAMFEKLGLKKVEGFNVIEDLISGSGIAKIYLSIANEVKTPEAIVSAYHSDANARHSIDIFLKALSQILSELAMVYMPGKGIFLAGGLMRTLYDFLDKKIFMDNFLVNRKTMHANVLAQIPIGMINQEMTCLHGSLNFINKFSQNLD